jgi:Beta-lactamase class C and other penicillin binding proteins
MKIRTLRTFSWLVVLYSLIIVALPTAAFAQGQAPATAPADQYTSALAAIEAKVEERRKALGIPGMSLAIVKDDKVIYSKGLGFKDFEKKVAATADTQFAIGSATKAFTGLSVLMTADEGKLSLDASPKTVLPYFKMADADTDKNMTIRDLLTHSSGLNRTDLAMITGKLTRAELIRVAGEAKPVAKLREKFGYQNLMYAAAGEIVAVAQKQSWEKFIPERVFKPLGMTNSTMSMKEMATVKDRSFGYSYNFDSKETKNLPYRDIDQIAPAGSINSSSNDMAKWLRFVLGGGSIDGKRLVSEAGFAEWIKPQMKVTPAGNVSYGLGWFIQDWQGNKVVQHGGNIDGFNSMVAMIPEKRLGFVMLTNVTASSLGNELMPIIWENILGKPQATNVDPMAEVAPEKEVGKYKIEAAGADLDVQWKDGKLTAIVPGQPTYILEKIGGRKYKLVGAPDGFFITFKGKELLLEQPQGNMTLPRNGVEQPPVDISEARLLVGKYESEANGRTVEVKESEGKVTLNIPGQQPYALVPKGKDTFNLPPLPDAYWLKVIRDDAGKFAKIAVVQPEGEFAFKPAGESKIAMTVDELMIKAIDASGGEANWKKLSSRVVNATLDLEQQGVKATSTTWAKAPNMTATETKMTALGKEIATGWEYFDGTGGEQIYSFSPAEKLTGKLLEDTRIGSDFYSMLAWRSKYKTITISRIAKVGDEDAYAVDFEPEKGSKFTEYFSTKTFLMLKREGSIPSSTSDMSIPYTILFEDYRDVDGVKVSFKQTNNTASNGAVVMVVTSVKHNVPLDDKVFAARKSQ